MALTVSTLTTTDELWALEEEWDGLLARMKPDLPFLWPAWVITWFEVFRQERPLIRDSLYVKAVRSDSAQLVALAPFLMTERPSVGPVRARSIGFIGADNYVSEQRAVIVDPTYESDVAVAIAEDLNRDSRWDWIAWEGLVKESEFAKALARVMDLDWMHSQPGNVLNVGTSWEAFKRGRKVHMKKSLRHCYNSLQRDGLTAQLEVATTPEEIEAALEIFLRLHAMLAQLTERNARPDRFAQPIPRRFLKLVVSRLAAKGMVRVFTLRIGGAPVASRIGFLLPECLYLYHSGYDPEWSYYAVPTTLVAEAIKYAIDAGRSRVHLSMGDDQSKSRWEPETQVFHAAVHAKPRRYSRAVLELYSWAHQDSGVLRLLKRLLGRKYQ